MRKNRTFLVHVLVCLQGSLCVCDCYLNFADVPCGTRQIRPESFRTEAQYYRQGKATNSVETSPGEFPWMASFRWKKSGQRFCGGSILTKRHILSAAHCFLDHNSYDVNPYRWTEVLVGENNGNKNYANWPHVLKFGVEEIWIHPSFSRRDYSYDVAIVRLSQDIEWSPFAQPVCLPDPLGGDEEEQGDEEEGDYGGESRKGGGSLYEIAGWGSTDAQNKLEMAESLRKAEIGRIYRREECQRVFERVGVRISDAHLCAGSNPGPHRGVVSDACYGDSGGPLMVSRDYKDGDKAQNKTVAIGVVAVSKGCAQFPGIYSRVSKHVNWIRDLVIHDSVLTL